MDYIKDTLDRMDIRQVRGFLLYGADDTTPYKEKLKAACDPIYKRFDSIYTNEEERDKAAALSQALTAHMYVYMELGMKAGVRLTYQLLLADD